MRRKVCKTMLVSTMALLLSMGTVAQAQTQTRPDPVGKEAESVTDQAMPWAATNKEVTWVLSIGSTYYEISHNNMTRTKELSVAPILSGGRTMLPARSISELLGIDLRFDDITKTAKFVYMSGVSENRPKENVIEITAGKPMMLVNGVPQPLSAKVVSVDGRVMLPLTDVQRALVELGLKVDIAWDGAAKHVIIKQGMQKEQ